MIMVKNLKKLRNEYKVSQQQLADIIGVSQQSINKYENHNTEPDIETLKALAGYFNTTVDYLIGYRINDRGKANGLKLTKHETELILNYRTLKPREKESVNLIIQNYRK